MKKSLLAMGLVLTLAVTACGNNKGNDASSSPSGTAPAPSSSQPASGGDPVTIKLVAKDWEGDPTTQRLLAAIEEGMKAEGKNIKLELVPVQSGTYSEKLGLLLQSGTIPDLIYFQGGDYQFAITQKILEDLTPYVENSTNLKASLTPYNLERLKNYPYLVWPSPTQTAVPVVRKDFFDKTTSGKTLLENPTIDNYYAFFKELKEKTGAKYAYTVPGALDEIDTTFNQAFGVTATWVKGADGKYVNSVTTPENKAKLEFYAKLYKEGLLDPEWLTKKWDTKEKAFYDGESAVIAGRQGKVLDLYEQKVTAQNGPGASIIPLPAAKGVAQAYTAIDVSKESRGWAISSTSKHKDLAFAILDYMASPKGLMLDHLGVEGTEYTIEGDKIKLTDQFPAWYARFIENPINLKPDKEIDPARPYMAEQAFASLDMVAKMSSKDNAFVIPAELAAKWDAATGYYKEFAANMVTGKQTAADFDKFVQNWLSAGGQAVTDYANETIK